MAPIEGRTLSITQGYLVLTLISKLFYSTSFRYTPSISPFYSSPSHNMPMASLYWLLQPRKSALSTTTLLIHFLPILELLRVILRSTANGFHLLTLFAILSSRILAYSSQ